MSVWEREIRNSASNSNEFFSPLLRISKGEEEKKFCQEKVGERRRWLKSFVNVVVVLRAANYKAEQFMKKVIF